MKKLLVFITLSFLSLSSGFEAVAADNNLYTSVIIDCRNLNLTRAMTPLVKVINGETIYPSDNDDYASLIKRGIVIYAKTLEMAQKHRIAGSNPLIIKAEEVDGIIRSNPVISRFDSIRLLMANQQSNFLGQNKVIILY